jgi:hypothetical protein
MNPPGCVTHGSDVTFTFTSTCYNTKIYVNDVLQSSTSSYTINSVTGPLPKIDVEATIKQYTITATPTNNPNGSITPSGGQSVNCGSDIEFTVAPEIGYRALLFIDGASVTLPPTKKYTFNNVQANHTIHVEFEEFPYYLIQFGPGQNDNAGGYVFPNLDPTAQHFVAVDSGTTSYQFTIKANDGYEIDKVYVDNIVNNLAALTGSYTFPTVVAHHSIFATFKPIMFTINATAGVNGTINPNGAVPVAYGADQIFQIIPNIGSAINEVIVDGVPNPAAATTGIYTFEDVTANHTIHATFVKSTYIISANAGPNGTITPMGDIEIENGDNQKFNFSANQGYKIDQVLIDGINTPTAVAAGSYTFQNVTGPHDITVLFAKIQLTIIATNTEGGYLYVDGLPLPLGGIITVEYGDHSPTIVFNSEIGYHVQAVIIDNVNNPQAVYDGFYRFMDVTTNHTIHVVFAPDNFTITATASQGGAINPSGVITVPNGTNKTFYFAPNPGYDLARVLVDGSEINGLPGEYTFENVSGNHTIAAQFEKKMYDVIYQPVPGALIAPVGGSVSPVEHGGNYKFMVNLEDGYSQSNIIVRANGLIVNPLGDVYTIKNIVVDQLITIDGVNPNKYEIVAQAFANGNITPAGVFVVTYGDSKTFNMTADFGFVVSDVVVNGESKGALETYTFYDIKENGTIKAYFKVAGQDVDDIEAVINVFSHQNVVTILNEKLVPVKQVEIMDMYGRTVWTGQALTDRTEITLDVAAGIYGVRITTDASTTTTKVSITK